MGKLDGMVAIVTGAGWGIGRGVALALAKEGAAVAIFEIKAQAGERTAAQIREIGGRALALKCDVGRRSEVDDAVAATVKEFGSVDILVNNAMAARNSLLEDTTDEEMEMALRSVVWGTFYCMQACLPFMKQRRAGKIINFGSGGATMGLELNGSYAIAKEAIRGLTKVAATEWGKFGINVNTICPMAATRAYNAYWERLDPEQRENELKIIPMRRIGDPEKDIGRAVVFLASPDSDFITSRTLHVDGGRSYYDR